VRLAWHDSGTYDRRIAEWPACGGANGSIRFEVELGHGANAGLVKGISTYLGPIKKRHPAVSWADLIQLGSACAVKHAGGPAIPVRFGRVDVPTEACCPAPGRLPEAAAPFPAGAPDAATHLRTVFHRMGFSDQEIVALSGAHTLGRAFQERSGTTSYGYGSAKGTAYTREDAVARADGKPGIGMAGGQSWTRAWLTFDNSYFQPANDPALLVLQTDAALQTDPLFRPHFLRYGADQAAFFADYAAAHAKLSELGSAFMPAHGIVIDI
jgi:L-ascorbate peroxidase